MPNNASFCNCSIVDLGRAGLFSVTSYAIICQAPSLHFWILKGLLDPYGKVGQSMRTNRNTCHIASEQIDIVSIMKERPLFSWRN